MVTFIEVSDYFCGDKVCMLLDAEETQILRIEPKSILHACNVEISVFIKRREIKQGHENENTSPTFSAFVHLLSTASQQ